MVKLEGEGGSEQEKPKVGVLGHIDGLLATKQDEVAGAAVIANQPEELQTSPDARMRETFVSLMGDHLHTIFSRGLHTDTNEENCFKRHESRVREIATFAARTMYDNLHAAFAANFAELGEEGAADRERTIFEMLNGAAMPTLDISISGFSCRELCFNFDNFPFTDPEVRRIIAREFLRAAMLGKAANGMSFNSKIRVLFEYLVSAYEQTSPNATRDTAHWVDVHGGSCQQTLAIRHLTNEGELYAQNGAPFGQDADQMFVDLMLALSASQDAPDVNGRLLALRGQWNAVQGTNDGTYNFESRRAVKNLFWGGKDSSGVAFTEAGIPYRASDRRRDIDSATHRIGQFAEMSNVQKPATYDELLDRVHQQGRVDAQAAQQLQEIRNSVVEAVRIAGSASFGNRGKSLKQILALLK